MVKREPRRFVRLAYLTEAIFHRGDIAFDFPLDLCRYPYGFRYGPAGWHPFIETLRQYRERRGDLRYEDSYLRHFYRSFQPSTSLELLFPPEVVAMHGESPLTTLPLATHRPALPWEAEVPLAEGEGPLSVQHGHQGFGPVTDTKGRWEFSRLVDTYESIAKDGFRANESGGIRGYFLTRGSDAVFIVRTGFHRMAVLSVLDHVDVQVGFAPDRARALSAETVSMWPLVRSGLYSEPLAARFVEQFFEDPSWHDRTLAPALRNGASSWPD